MECNTSKFPSYIQGGIDQGPSKKQLGIDRTHQNDVKKKMTYRTHFSIRLIKTVIRAVYRSIIDILKIFY